MVSFINPEEVLDQLKLKTGMTAADFGCGSGGFAIPLAKRLEDGLVYALDIQKEPLSALKSRALTENLTNIRFIRCDLEESKGSTLTDFSIDLVLIVNTLFQMENKGVIISEAERILKKSGKLLIIDWLPQASQGPMEGRISSNEVKKITKGYGFKLEKELEAGKYHYGLVFEKP